MQRGGIRVVLIGAGDTSLSSLATYAAAAHSLGMSVMWDPSNAKASWEVDFSDLGRLEHLVNRNLAPPHRAIHLFLSEWMIPTAPDPELPYHTTRAVQAQWITDAWRIVRHASFIYALGWIHLFDGPRHGSKSGLLDVHLKPKPGYYAYKAG